MTRGGPFRKMRHVKAWQRRWQPHVDPATGIRMAKWRPSRCGERRRRVQFLPALRIDGRAYRRRTRRRRP